MNAAVANMIDVSAERARSFDKLVKFQREYPLRSVNVNGRSWAFRRTLGRTAGQIPLVMLPGIQGGGDIFFETAMTLGRELPLITVSAPDIDDDAEMTEELAHFLLSLHLHRVHFLGSSLGGYLVQRFALSEPEIVDQLVIANGFYDATAFVAKLPPISTFVNMDAAVLVEKNLEPLMRGPEDDVGQVKLKAAVVALVGPMQTLDNYKSRLLLMIGSTPLMAPPISVERVMLIDDEHDPMIPPPMREAMRNRFATSELHRIDGGGHLPAIQRPEQFSTLLRQRFCNTIT
jgi:maspardin